MFVSDGHILLPPAEAFDLICDLQQWPLFRGYGPIPAIVAASVEGGALAVGSRIRVENSDGSVHHERVELFEPGRRYTVVMELSPPVSYLLSGIREEVELSPHGGGTRFLRRFLVTPRNLVTAPLAWVLTHLFLSPAVERHNAAVNRHIEQSRRTPAEP